MLLDLIVNVPGDRVDLSPRLLKVVPVRMEARRVLDDVIKKKFVAWNPLNRGDEEGVQFLLNFRTRLLVCKQGSEPLNI